MALSPICSNISLRSLDHPTLLVEIKCHLVVQFHLYLLRLIFIFDVHLYDEEGFVRNYEKDALISFKEYFENLSFSDTFILVLL